MESVRPVRQSWWQRPLAAFVVVISFGLLLAGHLALDAELWLGTEQTAGLRAFRSTCYLAWWCALRFPQFFGVVLLALLLGVMLFLLVSPSEGLGRSLDGLKPVSLALRFRDAAAGKAFRVLLLAGAALASVLAYLSVAGGNPPPLLWAATLGTVAGAFYAGDRASGRGTLLSRQEVGLLAAFFVELILLGYASRESSLRVPATTAIVLLVLSLWRRRILSGEAAAFGATVAIAFAVYTFDLGSWRYSFIGDEYNFFGFSTNLLTASRPPYLLKMTGAYDVHPVFSGVIQAGTMLLYGRDIYGWRVSETLAVLLAALPLYVFLRTFLGIRPAFVGLFIYLSSQHLLGFTKVGYPYSQLLVPLVGGIALLVLAMRRESLLGLFLAGVLATFAFYTFAFGIPFIALPVLLFALLAFTRDRAGFRKNLVGVAALLLGIGLTALPSLSDPEGLRQIALHTVANTEVKSANAFIDQMLPNWLYVLVASLTFAGHSHYVSGPHLDLVSSILMLLGFGSLIVAARRSRFALWLVICLPVVSLFVGGFAPYPFPPIARTYILVPFYAMFAAFGAAAIVPTLRAVVNQPRLFVAGWTVVLVLIPAANLYHFFVLTDRVSPQENLAMLVKEFQTQPAGTTFFVVGNQLNYNAARIVLPIYGFDPNRLSSLPEDSPAASLADLKRGDPPYTILVPWPSPARDRWRTELRSAWSDLSETLVKDGTGLVHFVELAVFDESATLNRPAPVPISPNAQPFVVSTGTNPRVSGQWAAEKPRDIAIGADELAYVINGAKKTIEVRTLDGKLVHTLSSARNEPFALAFTERQELLVLDSASRQALTRLTTDGVENARSGPDLGLTSPRGIAVAPTGDVYIADTGGGRIVKLNRELLEPAVFTTSVRLAQPTSLTFVGDNLVVADSPSLYVFSPTGELRKRWSISGYGTSQPPRFLSRQPELIVMTEPEPGQISVFDLEGNRLKLLGPPAYNPLRKPMGIAATPDGRIAIPELDGDSVRVITWGSP